jgi:hypothetical protein
MLGLRTRRGVPLVLIAPSRSGEVAELLRRRLAVARGGRLVLTSRGLALQSAVSVRLFT